MMELPDAAAALAFNEVLIFTSMEEFAHPGGWNDGELFILRLAMLNWHTYSQKTTFAMTSKHPPMQTRSRMFCVRNTSRNTQSPDSCGSLTMETEHWHWISWNSESLTASTKVGKRKFDIRGIFNGLYCCRANANIQHLSGGLWRWFSNGRNLPAGHIGLGFEKEGPEYLLQGRKDLHPHQGAIWKQKGNRRIH